jgi:DNA-binding response OmpR family regulator
MVGAPAKCPAVALLQCEGHTPFVGCRNILFVEAEPGIRGPVEEALKDEGVKFCSARDAGEASAYLEAECVPALVVVDYSFPLDEADRLLARLHSDPRLEHVPVLVTSAMPEARTVDADMYFPKPFDLEEFVRAVKTLAAGLFAQTEPERVVCRLAANGPAH